ncbi:MAG: hypothetical protein IID12_05465 [Candidatus Marinimicrobia bacterium]|nr:hypothetical protein [Candidatus Neomarinimicrobiota bacterium]
MNICYRILGLIILVSFLTPNESQAQDTTKPDFEAFIESLAKENVPGYVQPFATALGTAINSGIYHTAKIHGLPGFDIGIRAMIISIPDDGLSYTAVVGGDSIKNSPTVFGGASSNAFLPHGLDKGTVFFAVPQVSIGLLMGTELNFRYLPAIELSEDIGKLELIGFGLSHSLDQYFPAPIPLLPQLSAGFMFQSFKVGDILESSHKAFNLRLSKSVPMLTVYLGAQFESTDMDITYQLDGIGADIKVNVEGENQLRFTGGLRWTLFPFLGINGDYSLGEYSAINVGLIFSFDPPGVPGI